MTHDEERICHPATIRYLVQDVTCNGNPTNYCWFSTPLENADVARDVNAATSHRMTMYEEYSTTAGDDTADTDSTRHTAQEETATASSVKHPDDSYHLPTAFYNVTIVCDINHTTAFPLTHEEITTTSFCYNKSTYHYSGAMFMADWVTCEITPSHSLFLSTNLYAFVEQHESSLAATRRFSTQLPTTPAE